MTGDIDDESLQGIVPRAVYQIFDHLEGIKAEFSIRISCLELYNEVLSDLLVQDDESAMDSKRLRLVENSKQGKRF